MKNILLIDRVAPYSYDYTMLNEKGLGASESYMLYIFKELQKDMNITISQQRRNNIVKENNIKFIPSGYTYLEENYDTIIFQRIPYGLKEIKQKYPNAKLIIWLHDFFEGSQWAEMSKEELEFICNNATLLCVSEWHEENFDINLELRKIKNYNIDFVHFFIPQPKIMNEIPFDKNKLCFFSAGHKGLDFTLRVFEHLYKINNDFRLYIGNPTYDQLYEFENSKDVVINLGNITRDEVCNHLQSSLCALHLNRDYPETFGCVNAEANLMNTPVLCFDIGASKEILYAPFTTKQIITPNQYRVDLNNLVHITETIFNWRNKYPTILPNPILDKKNILEKWIEKIL
tara:strand:+ start:152 stop:1183 length:1032 start_codon:yes stop_codon:yes gene_type:complete